MTANGLEAKRLARRYGIEAMSVSDAEFRLRGQQVPVVFDHTVVDQLAWENEDLRAQLADAKAALKDAEGVG